LSVSSATNLDALTLVAHRPHRVSSLSPRVYWRRVNGGVNLLRF